MRQIPNFGFIKPIISMIKITRKSSVYAFLIILNLFFVSTQSQAQNNFKQLSLKNCFSIVLDARATSLPLQNAALRPLTFRFAEPFGANSNKAIFFDESCRHHLDDEANGFSKALYKTFKFNNIHVANAISSKFEQKLETKAGRIFLATFNTWLAVYHGEDVTQTEGYKTLEKLAEKGNGDATLQLYNLYFKNPTINQTNAIIVGYLEKAAEQGNNYAKNHLLYKYYNQAKEGSEEEKQALSNLFTNILEDTHPFERQYFADFCENKYLLENLPKLNDLACTEANKTIFPTIFIDQAKSNLGHKFTKEQMREALDLLIRALENRDKIYFNTVGRFSNSTQALILLAQATSLFNVNQFYEAAELDNFLKNYKKVMFDESSLIDVHALPFTISSLLTMDEKNSDFDLTEKEIDTLKIYADRLLALKESRYEACQDLSNNKFYKNRLWPDDLPVLSTLQIDSVTIEDFEDYGDGEGLLQIGGKISMMDPSKLTATSLMPNSAQSNSSCDVVLRDKATSLYPSEVQKNFEIDKIIEFPQNVEIANQSGYTRLEKSALFFIPPSVVKWEFSISDKININPNLSNFPFKIGGESTGILFSYSEVAHSGVWSILVDHDNKLLPFESGLQTNDQQNKNIKTSFESIQSDHDDLAIKINFSSNIDYYFLRIVFPSTLFVLLSVLAVLTPTHKVADLLSEAHLQVSTTVLVALVAYQFIIDSELPKLPYYTNLDVFLYCLLTSSALSIAHNLLPHISSSQTAHFRPISAALKYGTLLLFAYAILDFAAKYLNHYE